MTKCFALKRIIVTVCLLVAAIFFFECNDKAPKNDDTNLTTVLPSIKPSQTAGATPQNNDLKDNKIVLDDDWENDDGDTSAPKEEDVKNDVNISTTSPSAKPSQTAGATPEKNDSIDDEIDRDDDYEDGNSNGNSNSNGGNTVTKDDGLAADPVIKSAFADSVVYANSIANKIQAKYVDGNRNAYKVSNNNVILTEKMYPENNVLGTTITDKNSRFYFKDSLDVYAIDGNNDELIVMPAISKGKVNTTKLGYYYYDVNVRNLYMGYAGGISYPSNTSVNMTPSLWHTNDMGTPYIDSNGNFAVKVNDTYDPYFYTTGLNVNGSTVNSVEITLKTDKNSTNCALYFYTVDKPGFNPDQISFFNLITDGEFHSYVVPLNNAGKTIAGIRFDLGGSVGETVTVKNIRFAYTKQTKSPIAAEKTFHSYPDKIHFEASVLAADETLPIKDIKEYGYKVTFNKSEVSSMVIGSNGAALPPEIYKVYKNPEYIGIDIKNTGVLGFIIPNDGVNYGLKISETDTTYTLYIFNSFSGTISFGKPVSLSSRIYTDSTHSFDGIARVAKQERNPFTNITVKRTQRGRFAGYDYASGAYIFSIIGTDFNSAYSNAGKNVYYSSDISITASDERVIYISMMTDSGALEGAAIATKNGVSLPFPIEVCKNFKGEIEEPIYDPNDEAYGYSILPLKTSKNEKYEFTLYHLYQNWGKFPLKQISSINFFVSYYHLSTGVTESNCIAPYYVYGKDGWTLPDFRGCSGKMWDSQPQFDSVGRIYFTKHKDSKGNFVLSEYTHSEIRSSGNTYADIDYAYIADDGSYKYNLRHFELPQTDENRTMYEISLEFLKDTEFRDVKNDLSLFSFDGRSVTFSKASYLAQDNTSKVIKIRENSSSDIYVLGKNAPFFSYYDGKDIATGVASNMNFGLIVRNYSVTVNKKVWDGNLVFKNAFDGELNTGTLSLNMGKTVFKKGDKILLTLILLPYGSNNPASYKNVEYVIEDFVKYPFTLTAEKGTVIKDEFLPVIKCADNEAIVTVKGGRNNQTVKAVGYSTLGVPEIYEKINGKWQKYDYHVKGDFDGYAVQYENGQYSYSFVCDMGNNPKTAERTFKIVVK